MLLLAMVLIVLAIHVSVDTYAQTDNGEELDWVFDVKSDLSADVTALVTIHPSQTWSSYSLTFYSPVSSFAAFDYSTGASLPVSMSTTTNGGDKHSIGFPQGESDGYRFRVEFHMNGLGSETAGGFTISWSWGGGSGRTPQSIMVELPAGFNVVSVSDTQSNSAIPYSAWWDGARVAVTFQGTAVPQGYFKWRLTASSTDALPIITTVSSTIVTSVTTTEPLNPLVYVPLLGLGVAIGFIFTFVSFKSRFRKSERAREHIVCPSCGVSNPVGSSYCSECGKPLDTTQVYQ
jgi:hypothetical protein